MASLSSLLGKFNKVSRTAKVEKKAEDLSPYVKFRQQHAHSCRNHDRIQVVDGVRRVIGLMFIIIDSLPHEDIWRAWLADGSESDVHILIHAKFPDKVSSPWVRERLVTSFQYQPNWGSLDIARVMIGLLTEMLEKATDVHKLCFLSETCIPAVPFPHFRRAICRDNCSWVNYFNDTANGYAYQKQFEPLLQARFPRDCVYKSDQWVVLSRQHATAIVSLPTNLFGPRVSPSSGNVVSSPDTRLLDRAFARIHSADEVYFPTCLGLLGHLVEVQGSRSDASSSTEMGQQHACFSGILRKSTTYVQWPEDWTDSVHPIAFDTLSATLMQRVRVYNHPKVNKQLMRDYTSVSNEDILLAVKLDNYCHSALFLRKVKTTTAAAQVNLLDQWRRLVLGYGIEPRPDSVSGIVEEEISPDSVVVERKRKPSDDEVESSCDDAASSSKRPCTQE